MKLLALLVFWIPLVVLADARFVEAPAECHVPFNNANVNDEYKLQSCAGVLQSGGDAVYSAALFVKQDNVPGNLFVIDGQDVRDQDAYPGGELVVQTSGANSGTDCNIVSNGVTYATDRWNGVIRVFRTQSSDLVAVSYQLDCRGATEVVQ